LRLRDLHRERPHAPGRTDDQDPLPGMKRAEAAKPLQGGGRRDGMAAAGSNVFRWLSYEVVL
jgi:hypothetical protein